jgi:hypothetical protein
MQLTDILVKKHGKTSKTDFVNDISEVFID